MAFPLSVTKRFQDETVDQMLKRLKRKMKHDNRIIEMRKHEYYEKPSVKKRRKRRNGMRSSGGL